MFRIARSLLFPLLLGGCFAHCPDTRPNNPRPEQKDRRSEQERTQRSEQDRPDRGDQDIEQITQETQLPIEEAAPLEADEKQVKRGFIGTVKDPKSIDPRLTLDTLEHFIGAPAGVPLATRLFILLPATGQAPESYQELMRVAVTNGIHVLGIAYPNKPTMAKICENQPNDCFEKARHEIIFGEDTSPLVNIPAGDSIIGRITSTIKYQMQEFPEQKWDEFITEAGDLRWDRIVLAGHSQGGGHAAMIAREIEVLRVVFFSSPADRDVTMMGANAAPWITAKPFATPASRMYGLTHTKEDGTRKHNANFVAMGLREFGPAVNIETVAPPYMGSHILETSDLPTSGLIDPHVATCGDPAAVYEPNGRPHLAPVWRYMLLGR